MRENNKNKSIFGLEISSFKLNLLVQKRCGALHTYALTQAAFKSA